MSKRFQFWLLLTTLFLLWLGMVALAHARVGEIKQNPLYVPIIRQCTNYDDRLHCGRTFKQILALYDYRVCKVVVDEPRQCAEWYTPEELHYVFNNLPGWKD